MKNILTYFLITFLVLFSSCSIYENVYFNEDMSIKYQMKFDASEMMAMLPSMSGTNKSMPTDSIISIADIIAEYNSIETLSPEEQQILNDLKPLTLRINSDSIAKTFFVSLYGDFENAEALNKAFKALAEHKGGMLDAEPNAKAISQFDNISRYKWDGNTMIREIDPDMLQTKSSTNSAEENGFMDMFAGGKMIVKYHFPKKVNNVNNPDALLSQNGKTVVVEYSVKDFINSSDKINIEIETDK